MALVLWMGAMRAIVWSWNRHVPIVISAGFDVRPNLQRIGLVDVLRRHTVGWTFFFILWFVVLGISDFPLWQQLVIAALLAVAYGLSRIRRGEENRIGGTEPGRVAMFGEVRDKVWYRVLAIAEWAGYLSVIALTTTLILEALG
jgi:hypothetical protein